MNIKQLKSQSLLQEALCEALCELNDTRLRNLAITKVELSAGKESAKVFLDENSFDTETAVILSALKKASGAIRANISAQLSWYKVPNLSFEIDRDLAQMNRLDEIFKKIHAKENAESRVDSANYQNLVKNNLARSANLETRPLRGAKNRIQGCRSATADFLLEAEKRGTPPKSEKRSFWRVGGAGRGVQPFCEKETNKIDGKRGAESSTDSMDSATFLQGGLPRSLTLARNDEFLDSSLRKCFAQNDNCGESAESSLDSAPHSHSNTKKTK